MALPEQQLRTLHLFAGAGGGILGDLILGHTPVCAVEINTYARAVLLARQQDGTFPPFPIWDDVRTFDGTPWCGSVDVVEGGFPCQDVSTAGRGAGLAGDRSGLWFEMLRVIGEVRPRYVWAENSPLLRTRGLGTILEGLTTLGYNCRWGVVGAWHTGAPHLRKRLWLLAYPRVVDNPVRRRHRTPEGEVSARGNCPIDASRWAVEPRMDRVADGLACRTHRLVALGNGQVPQQSALAWSILTQGLSPR